MTIDRFLQIEQALGVRRTLVLALSIWLTYDSYQWAAQFATYTERTGIEVAAIVGAVTAPVSWIVIAVFKAYTDGKSGGSGGT
jgi:hypothetical protein